jgi:hypothetical protein
VNELRPLLLIGKWVKRRVDRVEFLDLTTVHRTIVLTLDLGRLADVVPPRDPDVAPRRDPVVPLGWFLPGSRAGTTVRDADGRVLPHLSREESRKIVFDAISARLPGFDVKALTAVDTHRGSDCVRLEHNDKFDGTAVLAAEKWGCPAVAEILEALHQTDSNEPPKNKVCETVEILMAWQSNYVLFLRPGEHPPPPSWETLTVSYDEQLQEWLPPWERRLAELGRNDLTRARARERRRYVSRGGPFERDLNELSPRWPRRYLARKRDIVLRLRPRGPREARLPLRRLARRGVLGLAWHVAWHEASGLDVQSHHVEVILPSELTVVRMRMTRQNSEGRVVTTAYQIGSRAAIVDPRDIAYGEDRHEPEDRARAIPSLFSLVVAQSSSGSWYGGAVVAFLTAIALFLGALVWRTQISSDNGAQDTVTVLVIAPTLISALISVRAGSDIAEQLIQTLRALIALIAVLAVVAALELIFTKDHGNTLRLLWIIDGVLLVFIGVVLCTGGRQLGRHRAFARASAAGDPAPLREVDVGKALLPPGQPPPPDWPLIPAPRIPPPDQWIASGEGDRVPWGWLDARSRKAVTHKSGTDPEDDRYWESTKGVVSAEEREALLRWVASIFEWLIPTKMTVENWVNRSVFERLVGWVASIFEWLIPTKATAQIAVNRSVFGQSVTFKATVGPIRSGEGTPTGTVTFSDGGSLNKTKDLADGEARLETAALAVGSRAITASYSGDVNFNKSTGSLSQLVLKAGTTTSVASSANPSVFGEPVTFTAALGAVAPGAGTPLGTVEFLVDGVSKAPGRRLSDGVATWTTRDLTAGSHVITARYSGDDNFTDSADPLTQLVD